MISIKLMLFILLIHFLADFVLQTHWQATHKSTSWVALHYHVTSYSLTWLMASWIWFEKIHLALIFFIITYIFHFITDAITARLSKPFFNNKDYHNGFVVVGFDQVVHYIQLIFTFELIQNLIYSL